MNMITDGQNKAMALPARITIATKAASGYEADVSIYLLDATGKIRGDADMLFFNNPASPDGTVRMDISPGITWIDIVGMPSGIERIAIAIAGDDATGGGRPLSTAGPIQIAVSEGTEYRPADLSKPALILMEVYQRNGETKIRAVGQGFDGGLAPLSRHFGVDVEDAPVQPAAPAPKPAGVDLRKQRLVSLEKTDPKLVSLAKSAGVSLEKKGVSTERAKVALVLDISASMNGLYRSGAVDRLVQRILAFGHQLDDDGQIDVFTLGKNANHYGTVDAGNYKDCVKDILDRYGLEPATMYGKTMEMVRRHYMSQPDAKAIPAYVMFVTDGGTQDQRKSETEIMDSSSEPIFWNFMAIGPMPKAGPFTGKKSNRLPRGFDFLAYLDDMQGRTVDNANFFAVASPDDPADSDLYDLMMEEYPSWLKDARAKGIITQ